MINKDRDENKHTHKIMITPMTIRCDKYRELEKQVALKDFPCAPQKGDSIFISGVEYIVVRREFHTNTGMIDASVDRLDPRRDVAELGTMFDHGAFRFL